MYKCAKCHKVLKTIRGLNRHKSAVHKEGKFSCERYTKKFSENDNLKRNKNGDNCGDKKKTKSFENGSAAKKKRIWKELTKKVIVFV